MKIWLCMIMLLVTNPLWAMEDDDRREEQIIKDNFSTNHQVVRFKQDYTQDGKFAYLHIKFDNGQEQNLENNGVQSYTLADFFQEHGDKILLVHSWRDADNQQWRFIDLDNGENFTIEGDQLVFNKDHSAFALIHDGSVFSRPLSVSIWNGYRTHWMPSFMRSQNEVYSEIGLTNLLEINDVKWLSDKMLSVDGKFCKIIKYTIEGDMDMLSPKCKKKVTSGQFVLNEKDVSHQWSIQKY